MPSEADDIAFASAAEIAALIKSRAVSPVEIVELVLGRIAHSQAMLNAFITVCDLGALEAAHAAEAAVACPVR